MKLFDEIQAAKYRGTGNAEEEIAQYAKRVIRLVDGNIYSDTIK